MGRKSTFSDVSVFASVGKELAVSGHLTMPRLTAVTGLSTGSIYHRFESREGLLAETWLHAVRMFQECFLEALQGPLPLAGELAALATPEFCRAHPDEAIVLACARREQFVGAGTPKSLVRQIKRVNDHAINEVKQFAKRINRPLLTCRLGLVAYPLAAVQIYLPHKPVPKAIDAEIIKAYRGAMGL